jgi:hypothetical protein
MNECLIATSKKKATTGHFKRIFSRNKLLQVVFYVKKVAFYFYEFILSLGRVACLICPFLLKGVYTVEEKESPIGSLNLIFFFGV